MFAKAFSVVACKLASIVNITSEPATASFVIYSSVIFPSTDISNCFIPFCPLKYSSNTYCIPTLPITSFISYVSSLPSNSACVILPTYPNMCDAKLPDGYDTSGSVVADIPGKYILCSPNFTALALLTSFAIVTGLMLLYPFLAISYLTTIILYASEISSCSILYSFFKE